MAVVDRVRELVAPVVADVGAELYDVEVDISEKWDKAKDHPDLVAELRALAENLDLEIGANARPTLTVDEPLFVAPDDQ